MRRNITRRDFIVSGAALLLGACSKKEPANKKEPAMTLEEYYNKAIQESSKGKGAWITGLNMLTKIIDKYPVPEALFIYGNGALIKNNFQIVCEHDHKDIETAISAYDFVLKDRPNHFGALINRGACYSALGTAKTYSPRYRLSALKPPHTWDMYRKKALQDYNRAVKLRPDSFAAHYGKAIVLEEIAGLDEYPSEAISEYQKAVELAKKSEFWMDHTPTMDEEAEVFIAQKPLCIISPTVKYFMDNWFSKEAGGNPVVIQTDTMGYIPGENDFEAFTHFQLGSIFSMYTVKRYDEAKASYEKAVKLNPQVPEFYRGQYGLFNTLDDLNAKLIAGKRQDTTNKHIHSLFNK